MVSEDTLASFAAASLTKINKENHAQKKSVTICGRRERERKGRTLDGLRVVLVILVLEHQFHLRLHPHLHLRHLGCQLGLLLLIQSLCGVNPSFEEKHTGKNKVSEKQKKRK